MDETGIAYPFSVKEGWYIHMSRLHVTTRISRNCIRVTGQLWPMTNPTASLCEKMIYNVPLRPGSPVERGLGDPIWQPSPCPKRNGPDRLAGVGSEHPTA